MIEDIILETKLENEIKSAMVRGIYRESDLDYTGLTYIPAPALCICEDKYLTHDQDDASDHGYYREYPIGILSTLTPGIIMDECTDAFLWQ